VQYLRDFGEIDSLGSPIEEVDIKFVHRIEKSPALLWVRGREVCVGVNPWCCFCGRDEVVALRMGYSRTNGVSPLNLCGGNNTWLSTGRIVKSRRSTRRVGNEYL